MIDCSTQGKGAIYMYARSLGTDVTTMTTSLSIVKNSGSINSTVCNNLKLKLSSSPLCPEASIVLNRFDDLEAWRL